MTAPPGFECGDVLTVFDYEFVDGSTAESKYFVIMGFHKGFVAGFLTTSQAKGGRIEKEGCHVEFGNYPTNFYLKAKNTVFEDGTWILLQVEWQKLESLNLKIQNGKAYRRLTFPDQTVRALRNCFKKSQDWAPIHDTYICGD